MGRPLTLLCLLVCVVPGQQAVAGLIEFTAPPAAESHDHTYSLGWQFTTTREITVDRLGYYNPQDGMQDTHDVGIYNLSRQLLVSGTVRPTDPLEGFFHYAAVSPIVLAANTTYRIAGSTAGSHDSFIYPYVDDAKNWTVDPAIQPWTNIHGYYESSATGALSFPTALAVCSAYFGPNLDIQGQSPAVPEPSSIALLALASGGVGAMLKRRRRQ